MVFNDDSDLLDLDFHSPSTSLKTAEITTLTIHFLRRKTVPSGGVMRRTKTIRFALLTGLTLAGSALTLPTSTAQAEVEPDWSSTASIPATGRPNPYGWDRETLPLKIRAGKIHALQYPIEVTGLMVPARPALKMLDAKPGDPLFKFLRTVLSIDTDFRDFRGFWDWLGLHDYPATEGDIPFPNGIRPDYPMGVSLIQRGNIQGLTLSCAACHSAELFGKPILGMTNRFPRANLFFIHGQAGVKLTSPSLFAAMTGANAEEKAMYAETRETIAAVGLKRPELLGLDTSLAQVALSLAKRKATPWAERDLELEQKPLVTLLDHKVADSKPAVWWNVKYKTHWLSDGSVQSGNPVFTNFLWNEIGRGADLPSLVEWVQKNSSKVDELTTAVFATEAPKWKDHLNESAIHLERAKHGEQLFNQSCFHCHGTYEKAWNLNPIAFAIARTLNPKLSMIDTIKVKYMGSAKTYNVGTDSGRREGMQALADALNPLAFSKQFGIVIAEQPGYVAPPLEGIWARFPYFHNNAIPNLCALMEKPSLRPATYFSGKSIDPDRDYDQDCVGYPTGEKTPTLWTEAKDSKDHFYDTRREGMSNSGHYERIFTKEDGTERFTGDDKKDLIEFLKTL